MTTRSAAGQAAGYHFQVQRGLLALLGGPPDAEVSIESLDDVAVSADGVDDLEQLKHSVNPGSLTDRSRPLWKAIDAWIDLVETRRLEQVRTLILVATAQAPAGSCAALLRRDDRAVEEAERRLAEVAAETPGTADTAASRARFAALSRPQRIELLTRVEVRDGTPGIGDFRQQLADTLGPFALPGVGVDEFLDKLVGWWERRAVDLLLRRRQTISRDELAEEVTRLRDQYSPHTLPAPDPSLAVELGDVVLGAYAGAPFVRQLELIAMRDQRVQMAVRDYHRAYAQRSRWLQQGVLRDSELFEWEDRLYDEWEHAWQRMLDRLDAGADEEAQVEAGKELYDALESSTRNPLRDRSEQFLHAGTLHGMADIIRVGWHPDFRARIQAVVGGVIAGRRTDHSFGEASGQ